MTPEQLRLLAHLVAAELARPEPWLDKPAAAKHFGCGVRWLEQRMTEGLPHAIIAGRVKFRASEAERWLESRGHIDRRGDRAYSGPQLNGAGGALTPRPPTPKE